MDLTRPRRREGKREDKANRIPSWLPSRSSRFRGLFRMERVMETVRIFDTTLRDGEQSPGATLTRPEKLEIARQLESMGVDIIEAGFPIASDGDFESVKAIAAEITKSTVCGLARSTPKDVERAGEAVKDAAKPRIHVFCATSKIHRDFKLRKGKEDII